MMPARTPPAGRISIAKRLDRLVAAASSSAARPARGVHCGRVREHARLELLPIAGPRRVRPTGSGPERIDVHQDARPTMGASLSSTGGDEAVAARPPVSSSSGFDDCRLRQPGWGVCSARLWSCCRGATRLPHKAVKCGPWSNRQRCRSVSRPPKRGARSWRVVAHDSVLLRAGIHRVLPTQADDAASASNS